MLMEVLEYGTKNAETVLLACRVRDWNLCLSPWKAPAVFGKQDFGGGAEDTLRELLDICPENAKA